MHLLLLQALASAHLSATALHHVLAAGGLHGVGGFLGRRLLLHSLLRGGGWILVLIVVIALVAVSQIARRR